LLFVDELSKNEVDKYNAAILFAYIGLDVKDITVLIIRTCGLINVKEDGIVLSPLPTYHAYLYVEGDKEDKGCEKGGNPSG
jgi:hypothetical protein